MLGIRKLSKKPKNADLHTKESAKPERVTLQGLSQLSLDDVNNNAQEGEEFNPADFLNEEEDEDSDNEILNRFKGRGTGGADATSVDKGEESDIPIPKISNSPTINRKGLPPTSKINGSKSNWKDL